MPQPKISVAVTTNNTGVEYLRETIPALLNQDYPNFEIVVTDDASIDSTEAFLKRFSKVRYFKLPPNENGYGANKNFCVDKCSGEYILLLDNDILVKDSNYLTDIFETYIREKDIGFLGSALIDKGKETTKYYGIYHSVYGINIHRKNITKDEFLSRSKQIEAGSYHGGGVFFSKSIWEKLGGYDTLQPFMLDDTDISARAYSKGYKVQIFNKYILDHIGINNHSNNDYFKWKFTHYYSGIATVQLKNLHWTRLYRLALFTIVSPLIYLSVAYKFKNLGILQAYFSSMLIFIKNLPKILSRRKSIQKNRTDSTDIFVLLKPPF